MQNKKLYLDEDERSVGGTYLITKEQLHSAAVIWNDYDSTSIMLARVLQGEGIGNLLMVGTLDT